MINTGCNCFWLLALHYGIYVLLSFKKGFVMLSEGRRFPHTRWMRSHSATSLAQSGALGQQSACAWRTRASLCETSLMFLRTPSPSSDGVKACKDSGGGQRQSSSLPIISTLLPQILDTVSLQREKVKVAYDLEGFSWPHCC